MSLSTIYSNSGRAQYLVHNNSSLLLGCQLLIFPMGHAAGQGTFFHSLRFQNESFFEVPDSVLKHFKKNEIYKIIDEFAIQYNNTFNTQF